MAVADTTVITNRAGSVVCESCAIADSFTRRLRGLLGRTDLAPGEGLLLRPSGSIHTWFMNFAIDAVFLDRDLRVVHIAGSIPPWRTARGRSARAVLELAAGEADRRRIGIGDVLVLDDGGLG
jgi:uncharacterized protein